MTSAIARSILSLIAKFILVYLLLVAASWPLAVGVRGICFCGPGYQFAHVAYDIIRYIHLFSTAVTILGLPVALLARHAKLRYFATGVPDPDATHNVALIELRVRDFTSVVIAVVLSGQHSGTVAIPIAAALLLVLLLILAVIRGKTSDHLIFKLLNFSRLALKVMLAVNLAFVLFVQPDSYCLYGDPCD